MNGHAEDVRTPRATIFDCAVLVLIVIIAIVLTDAGLSQTPQSPITNQGSP